MDRIRRTARELLRDLPLPLRHAVVAAVVLGAIGGIAGLVVGLDVHRATAWAAALEVGAPAGCLGFVAGLVSGSLVRLRTARRGGAAGARPVRR